MLASGCGLKEVIGPNANGTSNSDSYQPITKGSTWAYNIQLAGTNTPISATITMTGDVRTINGKVYYKGTEVTADGPSDGYFAHTGNVYISRSEDELDEPYLNDNLPAGATYTLSITDPASPSIPAQYLGTIVEKGISKTIGSKTFTNVIHTRTELQYNLGSGFQSSDKNEYYIAKGVGIIEIDGYLGSLLIARQTIVSYNIK